MTVNVKTQPVVLICLSVFIVLSLGLVYQRHGSTISHGVYDAYTKASHSSGGDDEAHTGSNTPVVPGTAEQIGTERFRLLMPASNPEINMCKTIITAHALGYPTPVLIGYNETYDHSAGMIAGGSHVMKIFGVLEYLESLDPSADDDIVMMMDAYGAFDYYDMPRNKEAHQQADIWFQLSAKVLLQRYYAINAAANERIEERLGRAAAIEEIKQTIIFGAGKRCAPNQPHTVACYAMPESPLPKDLYGANTDTIMGRNKYTSLRQNGLNSGYIMGPVKDLRPMFKRAWEKVEALADHPDWDNGSGGSDFMYHGSDQSIFGTMLGEQEFQRWVMRLRHLTQEDKARGFDKLPSTTIEGTLVDNPIDPSFTHEVVEHKKGKPDEFSMGLDYFSEIGQQTVNSEEDARWLVYNRKISEQVKGRDGLFDCPVRVDGTLPKDIVKDDPPFQSVKELSQELSREEKGARWEDVPLYTNLCLNTIPVMIHHNGVKEAREFQWPELWVQQHARTFMADVLHDTNLVDKIGGAQLKDGSFLSFFELCPADNAQELFRDVE